jgi:hypothetical protein
MRLNEVAGAIRRVRRMQEADGEPEGEKVKGKILIHHAGGDIEVTSSQQAAMAVKDLIERGQVNLFVISKSGSKPLIKKFNRMMKIEPAKGAEEPTK